MQAISDCLHFFIVHRTKKCFCWYSLINNLDEATGCTESCLKIVKPSLTAHAIKNPDSLQKFTCRTLERGLVSVVGYFYQP